ncbi:MAG: 5-oxoprolinase subunit PxpB [Candidatus Acidiferrum sp.]
MGRAFFRECRVGYTFGRMVTSSGARARFQVASDQSLIVYFDPPAKSSRAKAPPLQNQITIEGHEQIRRLLRLVELEPIVGVGNLHPAYCSLLIKFDALKLRHSELEEKLRSYIGRLEKVELAEPRLVEIPVCYGGEYGPDLKDVAELHGLTTEQAIKLHAAGTYIVYFLGFAPGFAYLGEVAEELVTPRLATPRRSVPAGSVGIAGRQTGVYPISTPGGWRLLGRTPVKMFQPERAKMSLLSIGDRVRFVAISREQFAKLENA